VVAGVFREEVRAWQGIPQAWECTELLDLSPGSTRRVWLLPGFAHPIGVATMIPGFGRAHAETMRAFPRLGAVIALVHDHSAGQVRVGAGGRIRIDYQPDAGDRAQLALGLREGARILFAAGAERVVVPYEAAPLELTDPGQLARIDARGVPPGSIALTAVHPMGTLRMGDDPRRAVVDSRGEHHAVAGLFVADGSLFPTSLGGPPQLSIYTFARHVAARVVEVARG
jgi:choline dehydrogenase-like flavoprotein